MKFIEDNAYNRSRVENASIIVKVQCKPLKGGKRCGGLGGRTPDCRVALKMLRLLNEELQPPERNPALLRSSKSL